MPTLSIYPQTEFPAIFKWQAIAFMRCEWSAIFQGDNLYMPETYPTENHPVHFVLAEGETLISYAAILEVKLSHQENVYHVYGFGNLFTFPPFRQQGYGKTILQAATRWIQASAVDVAILFCDPKLERFYSTSGWQVTHSPTHLGSPEEYRVYEPSRMMLFVSKMGIDHQQDFDRRPVYVDWPW